MVRITTPPLPKRWDVVRCYCEYPHDKHRDSTHPALVLTIIPAQEMGNKTPLVVVAVGTGTFDPKTGLRRKIALGEIPLNLELCQSAGLSKETKFCFDENGIFVFPWDNEFFRWDPETPHDQGEPLFGSLDTKCKGFERFSTTFAASPEYRLLEDVIRRLVQRLVLNDQK